MADRQTISFLDFRLDPTLGELFRADTEVMVEPQVLDLIAHLASHPGKIVTRDDLIEHVWGGRIVSDSAIASRINAARSALGDDGTSQKIIKTIPRRGFRFEPDVSDAAKSAPALPDKPSIAVLPFENLSGDPEQGYFSDGVTDDIITDLSRYDELFVIARHSSFAYRNSDKPAREIAQELGVQYIAEGSVRRAGNRIRVTAQLFDPHTGNQLWADRYDREMTDVFEVQDEIAGIIVNTLAGQIARQHYVRIRDKKPESIAAYEHLLRANEHALRIAPSDTLLARDEAEKALALDPGLAHAYAITALTYVNEGANFWVPDQQGAFRNAFEMARRAVATDPRDPWGYAMLGISELWHNRAHERAEQSMRRALDLNPNNAQIRSLLAYVLAFTGSPETALAEVDAAIRQNPHFPPLFHGFRGRALLILRRIEEALENLDQMVALMPGHSNALGYAAVGYAALDRLDQASAYVEELCRTNAYYRLEALRRQLPFRHRDDLDFILSNLAKAGLPDQAPFERPGTVFTARPLGAEGGFRIKPTSTRNRARNVLPSVAPGPGAGPDFKHKIREVKLHMYRLFLLSFPLVALLGLPASADPPSPQDQPPSTQNVHEMGHDLKEATFAVPDGQRKVSSDLAFQGKYAYQGNYDGFRVIDIAAPGNPKLVTEVECNGDQGDIVVYEHILVRSWNTKRSEERPCGGSIVPAGFEGIHVFDISDPAAPVLVGALELPCGSHTATFAGVDNGDMIVYSNNSSSGGCGVGLDRAGQDALGDFMDIIAVPLDDPGSTALIHREPLAGPLDPLVRTGCHDAGVILGDVNRAVCASADTINVWDISDKRDPALLFTIVEPGVGSSDTNGRWHSAGFSYDGGVIVAGWEPGGGGAGECEATDPALDKSMFFYNGNNGALLSAWVLERDQGEDENCTIHNYNMIPLRNGNDVVVMGNYQGGVWAVDFSEPEMPETVGWVDPESLGPGPFCGGFCQIGGSWSTYWYNGFIYDSDITRGLQIYGLSDKARASAQRLDRLNPQTVETVIE